MGGCERRHLLCFLLVAVIGSLCESQTITITMYNGGATGTSTPTGGVATDPTEANVGDSLLFTCVGTGFADSTAVTVEWTLPNSGRGTLVTSGVPVYDDSGAGRIVYSTLGSYNYFKTDCGKTLTCTFTQDEADTTGTTVLNILAPLGSALTLDLLADAASALSDPAADSSASSTPLAVKTDVGTKTLHVVDSKTYKFEATSDANSVKFTWERRATSSGSGTNIHTDNAPGSTECSATGDTGSFEITNIKYDVYDGQFVHVTASNDNTNSASSTQFVELEVEAEVDPANMEIWVTEDKTTMGTQVTTLSSHDLTQDTKYYVHCVVKQAVPAPDITADLGGDLGSGTSSATAFADVGEGTGVTLDQIQTTEYFEITSADYDDHCGKVLKCDANNNADTLLNDDAGDNNKDGPTITVKGGSTYSTVSLTLLNTGSGEDAASVSGAQVTGPTDVGGATLVVLNNLDYNLKAETDKTDPGVKFSWIFQKGEGDMSVLEPGSLPSQDITCTAEKDSDEYEFAGVSYDTHDDKKVSVEVDNEYGEPLTQTVTLEVQAEVDPDNMEIWVSSDVNTQGTEVTNDATYDAVAGDYYVHCVVKEAVPAPMITADVGGALTSEASTAFTATDQGEAAGKTLSQLRSTKTFKLPATYSQCNTEIKCIANNDADTLLDDANAGDNNKVGPKVILAGDGLTSVALEFQNAGSFAAAVSTAATTDLGDQSVGSSIILYLMHGNAYKFLATTDDIDPVEATFVWEAQDGSTGAKTMDLMTNTDPGSSVVTCTAAPDSHPYTLSATYQDHNDHRLYVGVTHNYMGTASEYVKLEIRNPVIAGNLLMYVTADGTNALTSTPVESPEFVAVGTTYNVHCVVRQAIPPPTITAFWGGAPLTAEASSEFTDVEIGAPNDRLSAKRYTIAPADGDDHCKVLECKASNEANTLVTAHDNNIPDEVVNTVTTALSGDAIAPDSVELSLLETAGASNAVNAAADSDTPAVALGEDHVFVNAKTAILVNKMKYTFEAETRNTVPDAEIDWFFGTDLAPGGDNPTPTADDKCDVTGPESDMYEFTADYDTHDGKVFKATASAATVTKMSTVTLDVQAEVAKSNMNFYLSDVATSRGTVVPEDIYLVDGKTYYVECQVDESTPVPDIAINLDGSPLAMAAAAATDTTPELTTGNLADFVSVERHEFTASYGTHCDKKLTCEAGNNANELLKSFDVAAYPDDPITICPDCTIKGINVMPGTPTLTVDMDEDTEDAADKVTMIDGDVYIFTCTPEGVADPEADLTFTVKDKDNMQIGNHDVKSSGQSVSDCSTDNKLTDHKITITAKREHHCGSLECKASSSIDTPGQTDIKTLEIYSPPKSITMYTGAVTSLPTGETMTSATTNVDEGDAFTFTCAAESALPAATLTWTLGVNEDPPTNQANADNAKFMNTFSTVTGTYTSAMCNMELKCSYTHSDTTGTGDDSTTFKVAVAPSEVTLSLLQADSGAAAIGDLIDITTDMMDVGETTLRVVNKMAYNFQAKTGNTDPPCEFDWDLQDVAGTAIGSNPSIQDNSRPTQTVTCNPEPDTNTQSITIDYDKHNGKIVHASADNDHDDAAVTDYVTLDVYIEVDPDNMEMYVSDDADDSGVKLAADTDLVLDEDKTYYQDCVVKEATPLPTIDGEWDGSTLGSAVVSPEFSNVGSGNMVDILTASQIQFSGDYSKCNKDISCVSRNDANTLLDNFDSRGVDQEIKFNVKVRSAPADVSLKFIDSGSGKTALSTAAVTDLTADTDIDTKTLIVIHGMVSNYESKATGDEEPSIVLERRTVSPSNTEVLVMESGGSAVTCTKVPNTATYSLTANYDQDNGKKLCAEAENSHSAVAVEACVDLEVRVEVKVENMELYVSEDSDSPGSQEVSSVTLTDDTKYYVDCLIRQATPAPSIDVELVGGTATINDEGDATMSNDDTGTRTSLLTGKKFSFTPVYANDCNKILTCKSGNDANDLLTGTSSGTTTVPKTLTVKVNHGPEAPTLELDETGDLPDNEDSTGATVLLMGGDTYTFKCTAAGVADPTADIKWSLKDMNDGELGSHTDDSGEDTADCIADANDESFQVLASSNRQCGSLTCTASNVVGEATATITDIKIIEPPTTVTLELMNVASGPGSGAAALQTAPRTDLDVDTVISGKILIVMNGESYMFQAETDELTPLATFKWQHRVNAGTLATQVDMKTAANQDISCTPAIDSDTWDLGGSVAYDMHDGKHIYVEAANTHSDPAVTTTVELDVYALVDVANMEMNVYNADTPTAALDDATGTITLTQGDTYFVDCKVTKAAPAPTITVLVDTDDLGVPTTVPTDNNGATLADLEITRRVNIVANFATHCGQDLICSASSTANNLQNDHDGTTDVSPSIAVTMLVLIDEVNAPILTVDEAGTNNDDQDGVPNNDKAILVDGLTYKFDCTVAIGATNPTANIGWSLTNSDGDEIDTEDDPSGALATECDTAGFTGEYTLIASVTHHNGYLECTAYNDQDSTGTTVRITFEVFKSPESIAMYKGGIPNPSTPVLGDPAGATNEVVEGDTVTFTCLASDANPSAKINWDLAGISMNDNEFILLDQSDEFYDTYSTLTTSAITYSHCGMKLSCTADHSESNTLNMPTAETCLMVGAPPIVVNLELLETGSGPAATSSNPYVDLKTNTIINQFVLRVIHGRTYIVQATTNAIDPGGKLDWFRTNDVNSPGGTSLRSGSLPPQTITCTAAEETDMLTIPNIDYDEWKNMGLRAEASNSNSATPVWQHVNFDVDVEVSAANMELFVSSDSNPNSKGTALNLNSVLSLEDGKTYYVYCDVKEATPPIDITLEWIGTFSGISPVVTDGSLAQLRSSRRFSLTPTINANNGQTLKCVASNDANKLLFNFQSNPISQSISVDVTVSSGPTTGQCTTACLNGGTCQASNTCSCTTGFTGSSCQTATGGTCNPTCQNGGTCQASNACLCVTGFTGPSCATVTGSNCTPACQNGGTCESSGTCTCPSDFTGNACQVPVNCSPPCQNGGACNAASNTCTCVTGWTGTRCQTATCSPQCGNGGTCNSPNTCSCTSSWTGPLCLTAVCNPNCMNGGMCINVGTCTCAAGFSGTFCQIGSSPPIGGSVTPGIIMASVTIVSIDGVQAQCTPGNTNPSTQEYQDLVNLLRPKLEAIFCTPVPSCTQLDITAFACGSIQVDFTMTYAANTEATVDDINNIIDTAGAGQGGDDTVNLGNGVVITPSETQLAATCFDACSNGGTCIGPNKCMCTSGYSGSQCQTSGLSTTSIIGIAAGGAGFLILLALVALCLYCAMRPRREERFQVARNPYEGSYVDQRYNPRSMNGFQVPYIADGSEALRYSQRY